MGTYEGVYHADGSRTTKATAKVIKEGPGYYRVVAQAEPLVAGEPTAQFQIYGVLEGMTVGLTGRANATDWGGKIEGGRLTADPGYYGIRLELKKVVQKSPTAGAQPPADAVVLLPYAPGQLPDTSAWSGGAWKPLEDGSLQCNPGKGSIVTKQQFGDMKLHLEFWLPLMEGSFGQGRANSGVIINNIYEVQVLDSFGLVPSMGDCGAVYNTARPRVNASFPPEQWQTYDIVFRAPRMNGRRNGEGEGASDGGSERRAGAGQRGNPGGHRRPRAGQAARQRGDGAVAVAGPQQPRSLPQRLAGGTEISSRAGDRGRMRLRSRPVLRSSFRVPLAAQWGVSSVSSQRASHWRTSR